MNKNNKNLRLTDEIKWLLVFTVKNERLINS